MVYLALVVFIPSSNSYYYLLCCVQKVYKYAIVFLVSSIPDLVPLYGLL